jgi:hypothetical protein
MIFEYNKNTFNSKKSKNFFTKSVLNDIYLTNVKSFLSSYIDSNIIENKLSTLIKKNIIDNINLLNNITESNSCYYHSGYLEYILCAISNNYGYEISPWNIWSIIVKQLYNLCNISIIDRHDKIIINEADPIYNITIDTLIMNQFEDNIKDIFIPQFISNTYQKNNYKLFINSILLSNTNSFKTVEINENYKRKNKIKIVGRQIDWNILYNSTQKLLTYILEKENFMSKTVNNIEYVNKLLEYVENIKNNWNKAYFWENFIMIKYVKGINQKMIYGDITNLFYESIFLDRLPVITSNIVFYNEYYKKEININCGVLTSYVDTKDNILICGTNIDIQPIDITTINGFIFDINKWICFEKQLQFLNLFNPDNIYNHINNNSFLVDNSVLIPLLDNKNFHENHLRKELLKTNYNYWFQYKNNIPFKNNLFIFLTYKSYEIKYPELNDQIINLFYNYGGINNFILKFLYLQNNNYFKYDLIFFVMNTLHKQLITDITLAFANVNYYYKSLMLHHIYNFIFNNIGYDQIIYLDSKIEKELREYFMDVFNDELTSIINDLD